MQVFIIFEGVKVLKGTFTSLFLHFCPPDPEKQFAKITGAVKELITVGHVIAVDCTLRAVSC